MELELALEEDCFSSTYEPVLSNGLFYSDSVRFLKPPKFGGFGKKPRFKRNPYNAYGCNDMGKGKGPSYKKVFNSSFPGILPKNPLPKDFAKMQKLISEIRLIKKTEYSKLFEDPKFTAGITHHPKGLGKLKIFDKKTKKQYGVPIIDITKSLKNWRK